MITGCLTVPPDLAVRAGHRVPWIRRAVRDGVRAEGRCVRAYTIVSGTTDGLPHTRRRFVFGFTTAEGREVRFEDPDVPSTTIEGDHLQVAYVRERPEHAVALYPGYRVPYGRLLLLGILAVFVVAGLALVLGGFAFSATADAFMGGSF
ncbi:DUF3592 domain-containing protein [Streptomyces sp. NPDC002574]|uniref:DUF3592 domain-containing protein n=1 Tax=Streptomyces sp. NPDC002574 TaxID=3364652 RepID=UPI0036B41043